MTPRKSALLTNANDTSGPNVSAMSNLSASPDHSLTDRNDTKSPQTPLVMASVLFKQVLTLLRSEQTDVTNATIGGLAQVNENILKDLMDELAIYVREATDRKQENMRRRKRREMLRVHLGRLFELISEKGIFGNCSTLFNTSLERGENSYMLNDNIVDYVEGMRLYLETESDKDTTQSVQTIKICFSRFLHHFIMSFPLDFRTSLFGRDLRKNLFYLFANWLPNNGDCFSKSQLTSSKSQQDHYRTYHHEQHDSLLYNSHTQCNTRSPSKSTARQQSANQNSSDNSIAANSGHSKSPPANDFEIATLQAMSSTLCCGSVFNSQILNEDSCLYPWLVHLMSSKNQDLKELGLETAILLLEYNPDVGNLLDWLVDCCYTKNNQIADLCFTALATIFSVRDHPCDRYIAIINVTLMNIGCLRSDIHHLAMDLMRLLDERFLIPNAQQFFTMCADESDDFILRNTGTKEVVATTPQRMTMRGQHQQDVVGDHLPVYDQMINKRRNSLDDDSQLEGADDELLLIGNQTGRDQPSQQGDDHYDSTSRLSDNCGTDRHRQSNNLHNANNNPFSYSNRSHPNRMTINLPPDTARDRMKPLIFKHIANNYNSCSQSTNTLNREHTDDPKQDGQQQIQSNRNHPNDIYRRSSEPKLSICHLNKIGSNFTSTANDFFKSNIAHNPCRVASDNMQTNFIGQLKEDPSMIGLRSPTSAYHERVCLPLIPDHSASQENSQNGQWCNQLDISRRMAELHPQLTMPIISEITYRVQTATPSMCQNLLTSFLPWLTNMELVDHNLTPNSIPPMAISANQTNLDSATSGTSTSNQSNRRDRIGSSRNQSRVADMVSNNQANHHQFRAEELEDGDDCIVNENGLSSVTVGWGSSEATQMVLNNFFHLAVKFSNHYPKEIEAIWAHLSVSMPNNMRTIIRFLFVMITLAPNELCEHVKRIALFMARANIGKFTDEIMNEMQTVEAINGLVERTQAPPFYRLTNLRKLNDDDNIDNDVILMDDALDNELFHYNNYNTTNTNSNNSNSNSNHNIDNNNTTNKSTATTKMFHRHHQLDTDNKSNLLSDHQKTATLPQPYPLPMPEFGGFYAPLNDFLPSQGQPTVGLHRCSLALVLVSGVIGKCGVVLDWTPHLPTMLNVCFLGLDHMKPFVHEHCKHLLTDLLTLLSRRSHVLSPLHTSSRTMTTGNDDDVVEHNSGLRHHHLSHHQRQMHSRIHYSHHVKQLGQNLEKLLSKPITIYNNNCEQTTLYINEILSHFQRELPQAKLRERWAEVSLQCALACSSRHYASRSLQIFRALKISPSPRMMTDILSRLVETVSEQGEDMQGYVSELMLTLEAIVDVLGRDFDSQHQASEQHPGNSNNKCLLKVNSKEATNTGKQDDNEQERSEEDDDEDTDSDYNFNNYRTNEANCALFFWIAVVMLETDYEHEFLLALKLLLKVLPLMPLNQSECIGRIEKNLIQMKWDNFPGVHALVLKGCTSASTYDTSIAVLNQLIPILDNPIIDNSESANSFPYNVMAQLTYLLLHYDVPNPTCVDIARQIASWCTEKSKKLDNLSTVMTLYSRRTFSKESLQWIKCVVKYLYDAYSHVFPNLISFLIEMLDKGPQQVHQHIISILYCILNYVDITSSAPGINADLVKIANKYVEAPQWKDALKIVKLIVSRSSALTTPSSFYNTNQSANYSSMTSSFHQSLPPTTSSSVYHYNHHNHHHHHHHHHSFSHQMMSPSSGGIGGLASNTSGFNSMTSPTSFTADTLSLASNTSSLTYGNDLDQTNNPTSTSGSGPTSGGPLGGRRELPGRTMDFGMDIKSMPLIGCKYLINKSTNNDQANSGDQVNQQATSGGNAGNGNNNNRSIVDKSTQHNLLNVNYYEGTTSPRKSLSYNNSFNEPLPHHWRRPWLAQVHIRERLVSLLSGCGQRIGLPKSPSVIFSQNSDNMLDNQPSSMAGSSTDEIAQSQNDLSEHDKLDIESCADEERFTMFRDFDFLEYELESQEGDNQDNFNWGVRRRSLSRIGDTPDEITVTGDNVNFCPDPLTADNDERSD